MPDHVITANFNSLFDQAQTTTSIYLAFAIREVKAQLEGTGIQPTAELVAAVMKTAQQDYHSALVKLAAQDVRAGLEDVAAAIREHAVATEATS